VALYVEKIGVQVRSILDPEKTIVVNNGDWIGSMSAVHLLRDIGKNFSISVMLGRESVSARLENGISFTEFTYMILQAYDFVKLFDLHGCRFQIGGSDQWGNMVSGLDLIRKMRGESAHVITFPLITTSSGKKFGKSEAGAIWMDRNKTSPYAFYQFWVNSEDPDVPRFLRYFTLLSQAQIATIETEHAARPELRGGHKRLAAEVTKLVHGEAELQKVILASDALFGGADLATADVNTLIEATASAPSCSVDLAAIPSVPDLLVSLGLATSKGDANRLLKGGGFYINNIQVAANASVTAADFLGGKVCVLRKGKRNYATVRSTE
jgi:tyrosyl-tRNA synthetase